MWINIFYRFFIIAMLYRLQLSHKIDKLKYNKSATIIYYECLITDINYKVILNMMKTFNFKRRFNNS